MHLVRAALRYVSTQDSKAVIADLKKIYQAATVVEAEQALEAFAQAWDAKYPTIAKMWRAKWTDIITLFDFPPPIRKAIYTTNAIESVNSVIRKFTRNRKIYPNEESALKIVYMAIHEASQKWTMPIHHWKQALNHFAILFEGRMPRANQQITFPARLTQKKLQGPFPARRYRERMLEEEVVQLLLTQRVAPTFSAGDYLDRLLGTQRIVGLHYSYHDAIKFSVEPFLRISLLTEVTATGGGCCFVWIFDPTSTSFLGIRVFFLFWRLGPIFVILGYYN